MEEKSKKQISVMRLALMLFAFVFASSHVFAQREVTGTVRDANGEPIMSAQVRVPGTEIGTITDFDGNYTLTVPEGHTSFEVLPLGGDPMTVNITGARVDVNFSRASATALDEVVVIGYGTVNRRDVVTAVSSISAEQIARRPVTSAAEAMQGQMAGVNVTMEDGSPDANISIRVRGGSSLTQNSEPLYIVDGIPVSNINDIAPSDIRSIDVLKDAASTAIYGAQGANGVIIITTKDASNKGEKFSWNVDYTGFMGWKRQVKRWQMLSVEEFIRMQYENAILNNRVAQDFGEFFDPNYPVGSSSSYTIDEARIRFTSILDHWQGEASTDWQDETFGRTGTNSNHSVTATVGNRNHNFRLSYNRIDDKGIMHESNFKRNNLQLRAQFRPAKDLTITAIGRYVNTEVLGAGANTDRANDGSNTESRVRNAIAYSPITLLSTQDGEELADPSQGGMFDPITTINDNYRLRTDNRYVISGRAQYKFLNNFTASTLWSYDLQERQTNRFYGPTSFAAREGDFSTGQASGPKRGFPATQIANSENVTFQNTNTLQYRNSFSRVHNVGLQIGHEMLQRTSQETTSRVLGYAPANITEEGVMEFFDARQTFANMNSIPAMYYFPDRTIIDPDDNMLSFFGRVDYDYMGRYYFTATMRADATARFTKENRWGYFPSMAVAWRMSEEFWFCEFARAASISDMKWRFSYGVAGNNNVDLLALFNSTFENFRLRDGEDEAGNPIKVISRFFERDSKLTPNPHLKWETTVTRNLGLDYGFFRGRLSGAVDVYWNSTKDLIVRLPGPGGKEQFQNVGETEVKGAELAINAVMLDKRARNLNYNLRVDANIGVNDYKVISLGGLDRLTTSTGYLDAESLYSRDVQFRFEEGRGLGRVWGFRYDGFYTANDFDGYGASGSVYANQWLKYDANGELKPVYSGLARGTSQGSNNVNAGEFNGARPGMMKLLDINGDGILTDADMVEIGNTMPLAVGGFAISGSIGGAKWGTVDVNASFTYSYGNDVINLTSLDLTTITERTKLRNNLSDVAYGNRYSLFKEDGTYIPSSGYATDVNSNIVGQAFEQMRQELADNNQNANTYTPTHFRRVLTDKNVEDGSYLRFTALTIGYTLPNDWTRKVKLNNARVFFSASNLFLWTNYKGNDPDVNSAANKNPLNTGVDWSPFPRSRAFNFGVNLAF